MKKLWYIPVLILGLVVIVKTIDMQMTRAQVGEFTGEGTPLEVDTSQVVIPNAFRVGVNLGRWGSWGAEQFGKNVIHNPGFEGEIGRIIVFVNRSDSTSFSDDRDQDYPDGMWEGAEWEVRTGVSEGAKGTVTRSVRSGADGLPQYFSSSVPQLGRGDAIVLTKKGAGDITRYWYVNQDMRSKISFDSNNRRPGSPGSQSLRLSAPSGGSAELGYYLDHITNRAGKLIKFEGKWRLSFWLKAEGSGRFVVSLVRFGSPNMLWEQVIPTNNWQEYSFEFDGIDTGPPDFVELKLRAYDTRMWIDDISLEPVEPNNTTAFRQAVIDSLEMIRPSFIRTLANFGDTFENRTAEPFARKYLLRRTNGNERGEGSFDFSYGEILDLCERVKANPWLVLPTTFSDEDYQKVGEFLSQYAGKNRFSEVIVEFGNENWNTVFRPQAFPPNYIEQHGIVASRAFDIIKAVSQDNVNLRFVVNGQHAFPTLSYQYYDSTPNADAYSPGAYLMDRLDANTPDSVALDLLFAEDPGFLQNHITAIKERGKTGTVYEFNLHTSAGTAPEPERDRVVAGRAAGVAVAKRALFAMGLGYNPVVAFALSQYDSNAWEAPGYVKLWGITRDFGPPVRYRPTGLAIAMLNRAIAGDMYRIKPINSPTEVASKLTTGAFKASDLWTAAVVSENNSDQVIEIQFPNDGHPLPKTYMVLQSNSPFDTNEISENVKIVEKNLEVNGRVVKFTVPAWGLAVLGSSADTTQPHPIPGTGPVPPTGEPTPTEPTPTEPTPTEPTPTEPTPTEPTPTEPTPTEPTPTEPTPTEPTPTEPTPTEPTLDQLRQRVRELEEKQQEILRDLQDLINILGVYNSSPSN